MSSTGGRKRKSPNLLMTSNSKQMKMLEESVAILKQLPLEDLANVSLANNYLKVSAAIVFQGFLNSSIEFHCDPEDQRQRLVFRQFGSLATKVKVTKICRSGEVFHDDGNKILTMIGQFCGANLKDLELAGMRIDLSSRDFPRESRSEVRNLLAGVKRLTLTNVKVSSNFLKFATSLEELTILSCDMGNLPGLVELPRLKKVSIGASPFLPFVAGTKFNKFLKKNPSIENIDYHFHTLGAGHLKSMCALPKLNRLKIVLADYDKKALSRIASIRHKLQHLDIFGHRKFSKLEKMLPNGCHFTFKEY